MRVVAVASCVLLLLLTGAGAQSLPEMIKTMTIAWNKPTEPFKVIGNIHYVGTNGLASYLITTPQGHFLVDTGLPEANSQIRANIAKLGFKIADIKYLLNTHAHLDHTGGFADLKQETGAQLVAGERDKPLLEGGYYPGQESAVELRFPAVKVDRTVKDGDTVTLGDTTLTAHATPGHSPGCTSWTLNVTDGNDTRSVIIFCSATVALNRLVGSSDLSRHHRRLQEDIRLGARVQGGRVSGSASRDVRHARQAAEDRRGCAQSVREAGRVQCLCRGPGEGLRGRPRQADGRAAAEAVKGRGGGRRFAAHALVDQANAKDAAAFLHKYQSKDLSDALSTPSKRDAVCADIKAWHGPYGSRFTDLVKWESSPAASASDKSAASTPGRKGRRRSSQ